VLEGLISAAGSGGASTAAADIIALATAAVLGVRSCLHVPVEAHPTSPDTSSTAGAMAIGVGGSRIGLCGTVAGATRRTSSPADGDGGASGGGGSNASAAVSFATVGRLI